MVRDAHDGCALLSYKVRAYLASSNDCTLVSTSYVLVLRPAPMLAPRHLQEQAE
jgi:hypothetical protein